MFDIDFSQYVYDLTFKLILKIINKRLKDARDYQFISNINLYLINHIAYSSLTCHTVTLFLVSDWRRSRAFCIGPWLSPNHCNTRLSVTRCSTILLTIQASSLHRSPRVISTRHSNMHRWTRRKFVTQHVSAMFFKKTMLWCNNSA